MKTKDLMKNIAHILIAIIIICVSFIPPWRAEAVLWEDHFDQEAKADWQHTGSDAVWTVEDGFLKTKIQAREQWSMIFERYQFIAYPGPYNGFTITLETVGATHARFGIALAKRFYDPVTEIEEHGYYLFFTNDMYTSRDDSLFIEPGQRWNTDELQQMELHFNDGRFQLSADGESRIDFTDANFDYIDTIAFVLAGFVTEDLNVGTASVDTFTIDGLAVSPIRKLATTWASLKQEQP
ncbi:hypothetical protein F4Z99_10635 [Candidatus Poribacteria bacterium]|nr:hypothetical protein [Candidatus Poribacteria bacterium]MYB01811.1 hypothetical protein [Candidatus Poribacteria bacterium]